MPNNNLKNIFVIVFFLAALILPLLDMLLGLDPMPSVNENRNLANLPSINRRWESINEFPGKYTDYFNDHFGFRQSFIRLNFLIHYRLLGQSPSKQVIVGKAGWLFFTGDKTLDDYRGVTKFSKEQLRDWKITLEMKRRWLGLHGKKYLLILVPNKETIYSDYLPSYVNKIRIKNCIDEFVDILNRKNSIDIIDVRGYMSNSFSKYQLYYKTGTHWNTYGAFIAYRYIDSKLRKIFDEDYKIDSIDGFDGYALTILPRKGSDLAAIIGGKELLNDTDVEIRVAGHVYNDLRTDSMGASRRPVVEKQTSVRLPRAIMFRDSFATALIPFLSKDFSYIQYLCERWDGEVQMEKLLRDSSADIVIEEYVERNVKYMPVYNLKDRFSMKMLKELFLDKQNVIFDLIKQNKCTVNNVEIVKQSNALHITAVGDDPYVAYNEVAGNYGGLYVANLVLNSFNSSEIKIYVTNDECKEFSEECSFRASVSKGDNDVFLPIYSDSGISSVRVDMGNSNDNMIIDTLVIKSLNSGSQK